MATLATTQVNPSHCHRQFMFLDLNLTGTISIGSFPFLSGRGWPRLAGGPGAAELDAEGPLARGGRRRLARGGRPQRKALQVAAEAHSGKEEAGKSVLIKHYMPL